MSSSALIGAYNRQKEGLTSLSLKDSVSCTLFQCLLAVDEVLKSKKDADAAGYEAVNSVIIGNKVVRLPVSGPNPTLRSLLKAPASSRADGADSKDILIGTVDDNLQYSYSLRAAGKAEYSLLEELEAFEHRALVRRQAPNLLKEGFTLATDAEMTRGVDESELMTFTELSHEEWYRLHKLQQAHDLLNTVSKALPAFTKQQEEAELLKGRAIEDAGEETKDQSVSAEEGNGGAAVLDAPTPSLVMNRTLYRQLSALSFSQMLAGECVKEPTVLKRYYKHTDELLLLLAWPAPDRRLGAHSWVPSDSITTPAALKALGNSGEGYRQDTLTVYPTGKAVVLAKQMLSSGSAWVSFYLEGSSFGLRHIDDLANKDRKRSEFSESIAGSKGAMVSGRDDNGSVGTTGDGEGEGEGTGEGEGEEKDGGEGAGAEADADAEGEADAGEGNEEEEEELDEEEKAARAEAAARKRLEELERKKEEERLAAEAKAKAAAEAKPALFAFCGADGVRVNVVPGPSPEPSLKPDKMGTVAMAVTDAMGLRVTSCSNGTVRIADVPLEIQRASGEEGLGVETARTLSHLGTITRALATGPYSKDILFPDGSRVLVVDTSFDMGGYRKAHPDKHDHSHSHSHAASRGGPPKMPGFHEKLLSASPPRCTYARLDVAGTITYFTNAVGAQELPSTTFPAAAQAELFKDIRKHCVDAQTGAHVSAFMDGRVLVAHTNKVTDLAWPDGTRSVTADGKDGKVVYISKSGFPCVECDVDVEEMCSGHSQGKQVTLSKGGLRVRSRVSLSDGSALLIKYDTRITATTNGSLKLVRRDRTVITATDAGEVQVYPKTVWDAAAAATFAEECRDTYIPTITASAEEGTSAVAAESLVVAGGAPAPAPAPALEAGAVEKSVSIAAAGAGAPQASMSITAGGTQSMVAEASSATAKSLAAPTGPGADTLATLSTTYIFNILKESVSVEDDEYNRFQLSLGDVLNPAVDLAGEVSGLKPVAITERPLDPRLFIVNRDGDATEVVSDALLTDWIKHTRDCEDVNMTRAIVADVLTSLSADDHHQHQLMMDNAAARAAPSGVVEGGSSVDNPGDANSNLQQGSSEAHGHRQPEGINNSTSVASSPSHAGAGAGMAPPQDPSFVALPLPLQSFCFQKRRRLGSVEDGYPFHEVFGAREWQTKPLPAVASMDRKLTQAREQEHKAHQQQQQQQQQQQHRGAGAGQDKGKGGKNRGREDPPAAAAAAEAAANEAAIASAAAARLVPPKVFDTLSLTQKPQAMARSHKQVAEEYARWTGFLAARDNSMDRFDVTDYRAQAEQDEEAVLAERLKAIYKALKKKAKQERVNAANQQYGGGNAAGAGAGGGGGPPPPDVPSESQELLELSINSDDGSDTIARKNERRDAVPPLEQEINTAFADFCNGAGAVIELAELRGALVQIFNCHVPTDTIQRAVMGVAPHLFQEGAGGSGMVEGGRLVVGAPVAQAVVSPVVGGAAAVPAAMAEPLSLEPSVGTPQLAGGGPSQASGSLFASQVHAHAHAGAAGNADAFAATAAVQGLTRTEFGSVYEAVEYYLRAEEEGLLAVTPGDEMGMEQFGEYGEEAVPESDPAAALPRSQSEPAGVVLAREAASNSGIPQEPSQVSAWGAMEQGSQVEGSQAQTSNQSNAGRSGGEGSGSQEPSLERLSKTAPGKAQNPNQHWYPETEDILNTSPSKGMANTTSVPQGSARNAAAAARQSRPN